MECSSRPFLGNRKCYRRRMGYRHSRGPCFQARVCFQHRQMLAYFTEPSLTLYFFVVNEHPEKMQIPPHIQARVRFCDGVWDSSIVFRTQDDRCIIWRSSQRWRQSRSHFVLYSLVSALSFETEMIRVRPCLVFPRVNLAVFSKLSVRETSWGLISLPYELIFYYPTII